MATPAMMSLARKTGVSLATAERYWEQVERSEEKKDWLPVMRTIKRSLGLDNESLVLCGWPVRLVIEASDKDEEGDEPEKTVSLVFDIDKLERSDRGKLLRDLKGKDLTVQWRMLKGQTLCVPSLGEKDQEKVEKILKKHGVKSSTEKESVEPLLVSLFLLEFYRVHELHEPSEILNEEGKADIDGVVEGIELLESTADYKKYLLALFPNVDPDLYAFLADQPPRS